MNLKNIQWFHWAAPQTFYPLAGKLWRPFAVLAAVLDAALQDPSRHALIMRELITPLLQQHDESKREASRKAAATKVEFFTLVRGDG